VVDLTISQMLIVFGLLINVYAKLISKKYIVNWFKDGSSHLKQVNRILWYL